MTISDVCAEVYAGLHAEYPQSRAPGLPGVDPQYGTLKTWRERWGSPLGTVPICLLECIGWVGLMFRPTVVLVLFDSSQRQFASKPMICAIVLSVGSPVIGDV